MNSSSSGVLRQPFVANEPHLMGSADRAHLDPVSARRTEDARKAGYEQGFADGAKAAEAAAKRSAEAAAARLREAASRAVSDLESTTVGMVPELVETAVAIARHLVASVPEQLSAALVERITQALDSIDDERLTVHVSPTDEGTVTGGFAAAPTITFAVDPALGPGEARIEGTWARADLTLPTAWRLIEESLHA